MVKEYWKELQGILDKSARVRRESLEAIALQNDGVPVENPSPSEEVNRTEVTGNESPEELRKTKDNSGFTQEETAILAREFAKRAFQDPNFLGSETILEQNRKGKWKFQMPMPSRGFDLRRSATKVYNEYNNNYDEGPTPLDVPNNALNVSKPESDSDLEAERVTPNVSELSLGDFKGEDPELDKDLNNYTRALKAIAAFLFVSGVILFIFLLGIAFYSDLDDFSRTYFVEHAFTLLFLLTGAVYPPIQGVYIIFTLGKIKEIRVYLLRIPFTLLLPLGFITCMTLYVSFIDENSVDAYLTQLMTNYDEFPVTKTVIDGLQTFFLCCGRHNAQDWKMYLTTPGMTEYPKSCCANKTDSACPNSISAFYSDGCTKSIIRLNRGIALFMLSIAIIQCLLMVLSLYFMRKLYNLIRYDMRDPRTNCQILCGKTFSICEMKNEDDEEERPNISRL